MNEEVKKLWIDALRSGEYKKGVGKLHKLFMTGDEFCCLGVLCDVAIKNGVDVPKQETDFGTISYGDLSESGYLPVEVMQWAELDFRNPYVRDGGTMITLVNLNDSRQDDNFPEIADAIEAQL